MEHHKASQPEDFLWFWNKLNEHLEKSQLKQTQQRKVIVETFLALGKHVDADRLFMQLKADGHTIGLATIYRTLNLLTEAGLLEQKQFSEGKTLFEVQDPDQHHDHLLCLDCGKVFEFENAEIEAIQETIAKKKGFLLERHSLDLYGRCLKKNSCPNITNQFTSK